MTYLGKLPSIKLLGTLIPFFRLRFTELRSDWSKRYLRDFRAFWSFKRSNGCILGHHSSHTFNPCNYSDLNPTTKE